MRGLQLAALSFRNIPHSTVSSAQYLRPSRACAQIAHPGTIRAVACDMPGIKETDALMLTARAKENSNIEVSWKGFERFFSRAPSREKRRRVIA